MVSKVEWAIKTRTRSAVIYSFFRPKSVIHGRRGRNHNDRFHDISQYLRAYISRISHVAKVHDLEIVGEEKRLKPLYDPTKE